MAISKIIYKSSPSATPETWMDATGATAAASDIISPKTAMLADGVVTTGMGTTPTGTKQISITQNGTTTEDVAAFANAEITADVQGGGGITWDGLVSDAYINTDVTVTASTWTSPFPLQTVKLNRLILPNYQRSIGQWGQNSQWKEVYAPELTDLGLYGLRGNKRLTNVYFPKMESLGTNFGFEGCSALEGIVLPALNNRIGTTTFQGNVALRYGDFGKATAIEASAFYKASALTVLVIRNSDSIAALTNINAFDNTPFASNGSGGTLYVPQSRLTEYTQATNWSTILGYANNQILPIEGSAYENAYADGTPIT